MRILLIEDERMIASAVKEGLEQDGYAVDVEYDGEAGVRAVQADEYDIVVSDIMMPNMDGYGVCRTIRKDGYVMPIILLTAKGQEHDIVQGLDAGADDYVTKPFSINVLSARIRALLRRPRETIGETLSYADVVLDPAKKTVTRNSVELHLSTKEFAILEYFLRNPERILSKSNIQTHVWDFDADVLPNTIESFIKLLRNKVDKPFSTNVIQTVYGFGYKLQESSSQ